MLRAWLAGEVYVPRNRGGFMSKSWDAFVPDLAVWRECFRVLKPGGHLLAFGGTRTLELVGIGIRLAGFERRDLILWMYGSGFPKSLDVSKAINKAAGAERQVVAPDPEAARRNRATPQFGGHSMNEYDPGYDGPLGRTGITASATEDAATWEGWGTALKPAVEPIIVARKPLEGTVATNVLAYGTGALNIDACRVETGDALGGGAETATTRAQKGNEGWERPWMDDAEAREAHAERVRGNVARAERLGRWPANVVVSHTEDCFRVGERRVAADGHWPAARPAGSELAGASGHTGQEERAARGETVEVWECADGCPVALLDAQSGPAGAAAPVLGTEPSGAFSGGVYGEMARAGGAFHDDSGGASRFFYCAKTSRAERNAGLEEFAPRFAPTMGNGIGGKEHDPATATPKANVHPTVKPVDLMRWLVRLVARPGALVCDPFLGSGSTGIACGLEGVRFVGIEREADYLAIAEARLRFWAEHGEDALRIVTERDAADRVRRVREDAGQLDLFAQADA